jgi:N-carbamoylputrescine amidase
VVLDADGSIAGKYRKMHIPDDPLYYEKFYFTPGDLGFPSFQTRYAKIAVLVCWDQWFPEAARAAALAGAQILFYPTAIGWIPKEPPKVAQNQRNAWEMMQRSHAIANGVFVASANRVGSEGKIKFWGNSFVAGPLGEIVAHAGDKREEILLANCDLKKIDETRQSWPFLRDRRIDAYGATLDALARSLTTRFESPIRWQAFPSSSTPAGLGYSMPAEWAHRATWLSWPHNLETWPTYLENVRDVWLRIIGGAVAP